MKLEWVKSKKHSGWGAGVAPPPQLYPTQMPWTPLHADMHDTGLTFSATPYSGWRERSQVSHPACAHEGFVSLHPK